MATTVAGEESDTLPFESAEDEGVRGPTEGSFNAEFPGVSEAGHGVEAAATDDADFGMSLGAG